MSTRDELLSLTAWQMLYGCIPLIAAAWLVPERPIEWTGAFLAALSFNAVGGMAIATLLWLYILYRLPATISSLSSLIVPIVGVLAAWIQLGERPSLAEGHGHAPDPRRPRPADRAAAHRAARDGRLTAG